MIGAVLARSRRHRPPSLREPPPVASATLPAIFRRTRRAPGSGSPRRGGGSRARCRRRVGRDHLGHHLLPNSMPSSTSARSIAATARSRASSSTRSCVLFRMKPAGTRKTLCTASPVQSKVEISGFFLSSLAMSPRHSPPRSGLGEGSPGAAVDGDVGRRPPVSSSMTSRAKSSVIVSSLFMRALFSTRALTRRR